MTTATGNFELHDWQQDIYDEGPGSQLATATNCKTFHGDIEGTSSARLIFIGIPDESGEYQGRAYVGVERITGSVHGRKGEFTLVHNADMATGMTVTVIAGSATDDLRGLQGNLHIDRAEDGSHTYSFDYTLT